MTGSRSLHIVAFPWLAFGHMIPFLELSKALAARGHKVSYLCTPWNLQRLPKVPPSLSPLINFVTLPLQPLNIVDPDFSSDHDQNPQEATSDLPPDQVQYLKRSFDGLEGAVDDFLREGASPKPDWVIQDFAAHWLPAAAAKHGIPCAFFSVFPVPSLVYIGPIQHQKRISTRVRPEDFTTPPSWVPFPSTVAYKLHEIRGLMAAFSDGNASGVSDVYRIETTIETCQAVVVRSVDEFDGRYTEVLRDLYEKPVIAAGLLPPASVPERGELGPGGVTILEWLDKQSHGSVVYVAFGSEAALSIEFVHELALGLEMSQRPFLWALRRPSGLPADESGRLLPDGFEERTRGRGLVLTSWLPQVSVLAHASVGAFLTHSGWSSVIEALRFGIPLISLPVSNDQGLNSRMVVEKNIAIEIERDEEDGSFTRESVAKAVGKVMMGEEEEGERVKTEARRWSSVVGDMKLQDQFVDGLAHYLADHSNDLLQM